MVRGSRAQAPGDRPPDGRHAARPERLHRLEALGYRPSHGRWVSEAEYAAEEAAAEEQKEADRYWEPRLAALARRLHGADQDRESVEREMAGVTDPRAVPAIWRIFATGAPSQLDVAIRLLGQIDSPESSRRLATLIDADQRGDTIEKAEREVRLLGLFIPALREDAAKLAAERQAYPCEQALAILRHRDPRDFLDELIDSLQAPVTVEVQRGSDRFSGTLRVESETLHFRRTYNPSFVRVQADTLVRIQAGTLRKNSRVVGHDINREYQQALDDQAAVDRKNRKVSAPCAELTGRSVSDSDPVRAREDLKAWWADKRGYPYSPGEPRRKRTVDQVSPVTIYWCTSHSCFAAGTPVRTLLGLRPIESIQVGDLVLAQDVTTGALGFEPVVGLHHNTPKPTLRIDLGDEAFVATAIHRFWKVGQGWAMARELKVGDEIRRLGGTARVVSIREEKVQPVFNLDVDRCRTTSSAPRGAWCTTTASSIRSSTRSMPRRRRRPRPPPPAEGPPGGREPVADRPRSIVGRSSSLRAMPATLGSRVQALRS